MRGLAVVIVEGRQMHIYYGWKDKARGIRLCEGFKYYEWFQLNFRSVLIQFPNKYLIYLAKSFGAELAEHDFWS